MSVLSIYRRMSWPAWRAMYRRPLPEPLAVLNLISYRHRERFSWYLLLVAPAMLLIGARPRWAGDWVRSLHGECQGESLMLVHYPNHRRFLLMVTNPYYALINLVRENADRKLEAAFTQPQGEAAELAAQASLVVAHCISPEQAETVTRLLLEAGTDRIFSVHEIAAMDFFRELTPSDPNPLRLKHVIFFRPGSLSAGLPEILQAQLAQLAPGMSLQLYRRLGTRELLPRAVRSRTPG